MLKTNFRRVLEVPFVCCHSSFFFTIDTVTQAGALSINENECLKGVFRTGLVEKRNPVLLRDGWGCAGHEDGWKMNRFVFFDAK